MVHDPLPLAALLASEGHDVALWRYLIVSFIGSRQDRSVNSESIMTGTKLAGSVRRAAMALAMILSLALAAVPSPALATENGRTHADLGYLDTLTGVALPPGFYVRDDVLLQTSARFDNGHGKAVTINLGGPIALGAKFRDTLEADILSAAYVPAFRVPWIDATVGAAFYVPAVRTRAELATRLGIPQATARDTAGLADMTVIPLFLAFQAMGVHVAVSPFEFTAPTGRYDVSDPIGSSAGLNYWSYRPSMAITVLSGHGQDFSVNMGLSFNARNPATRYTSGSEAYVTYAGQQHLPSGFSVGVGGYYYKQISDDRLRGNVVAQTPATDPLGLGRGNRGETFAIGPLVSKTFEAGWTLQAHWDHEVTAYDRPKSDLVYIRTMLRF